MSAQLSYEASETPHVLEGDLKIDFNTVAQKLDLGMAKVCWLLVMVTRRNYLASIRSSLYVSNYDIGRTSPLNQAL